MKSKSSIVSVAFFVDSSFENVWNLEIYFFIDETNPTITFEPFDLNS